MKVFSTFIALITSSWPLVIERFIPSLKELEETIDSSKKSRNLRDSVIRDLRLIEEAMDDAVPKLNMEAITIDNSKELTTKPSESDLTNNVRLFSSTSRTPFTIGFFCVSNLTPNNSRVLN